MNHFSIILPVKNGGELIKECVSSILSQTYPYFNLIILDSNSSDGTKEWIENLNKEKVIIHHSNHDLTIEENWGRIKEIAKNEFITLIGHDDVLLPEYLERMNELINQFPKASLYQAHFNYVDVVGSVIRTCKKMPERLTGADFIEAHIDQTLDSMGTGYIMRSKDFNLLGGMPRNYPALLFADYELLLNLTSKSFLATTKYILFHYRLHNSTSKITDALKYQTAFLEYLQFLINIKSKHEDIAKIIQKKGHILMNFYCTSLSHRLLRVDKNLRKKTVSDFVNECVMLASKLLGSQNKFKPYRSIKILSAIILEQSTIGLYLFSKYKKLKYG